MYGDKDGQATVAQSEAVETKLKAAGVTVTLLRVPAGGHGATFPEP